MTFGPKPKITSYRRPKDWVVTAKWQVWRVDIGGLAGTWVHFMRERDKLQSISVTLDDKGRVKLISGGKDAGLKRKRRERVKGVTAAAIAYVQLMGTLTGAPEFDVI